MHWWDRAFRVAICNRWFQCAEAFNILWLVDTLKDTRGRSVFSCCKQNQWRVCIEIGVKSAEPDCICQWSLRRESICLFLKFVHVHTNTDLILLFLIFLKEKDHVLMVSAHILIVCCCCCCSTTLTPFKTGERSRVHGVSSHFDPLPFSNL